jgi:hypothetical protein
MGIEEGNQENILVDRRNQLPIRRRGEEVVEILRESDDGGNTVVAAAAAVGTVGKDGVNCGGRS